MNSYLEYVICKRCIMDTSDSDISFDSNGVCNHCYRYDEVVKPNLLSEEIKRQKLKNIFAKIKSSNKKINTIVLLVLVAELIAPM